MHASDIAFDDVLLVMAAAVVVPLLLGLVPRLPIPSSVVEIMAGIVIGPALLGWVSDDPVVDVFAKLGVALLLFLAGLEMDFAKLRGRPLQLGLLSFLASLGLGLLLALPLGALDIVVDPLLVAIILSATSLGIVCPVLVRIGGSVHDDPEARRARPARGRHRVPGVATRALA